MKRNMNSKVAICCSIVATVCFEIVSYGHFLRGRMELGLIFTVLTVAQLISALRCITSQKGYKLNNLCTEMKKRKD